MTNNEDLHQTSNNDLRQNLLQQICLKIQENYKIDYIKPTGATFKALRRK